MPTFAVIVAAAGKSDRFGGQEKKTFAKLDGRPVFLRTLEQFINRDDVCATLLAVAPEDVSEMKERYGANLGFMGVKLVEGGARRCDTVKLALQAVPEDADFVAVHDAARPCVSEDMIQRVFDEAEKTSAAILATPLTGTIKRVSDAGVIEETVPRTALYEAQTPQVFRKDVLVEAYAGLSEVEQEITDDAQLVEQTGHAVSIVVSDASNIKITARSDMAIASAVIKSRPKKSGPKLGAFDEAQW